MKEFVQREVLAREARRQELDRRPEVQAKIAEAIRVILIRALFKQVTAQAMPSPAEIRAYYQTHEAEFRIPEQVEVDQVRVPTEAEAEAIRTAVAAGQAFDAAVMVRTEAPINIATFPQGLRDSEVERVTFALKVGEVSQPIRARDGAYLFRLRAHLPARLQPLEGVTPVIQSRLATENRKRLWQQLEDRLWTADGVEIREDLLEAAMPRSVPPRRQHRRRGKEAPHDGGLKTLTERSRLCLLVLSSNRHRFTRNRPEVVPLS